MDKIYLLRYINNLNRHQVIIGGLNYIDIVIKYRNVDFIVSLTECQDDLMPLQGEVECTHTSP